MKLGYRNHGKAVISPECMEIMNNFLSLDDQDYSLWWLILYVRRAMYKARSRELLPYEIKPEKAAVLYFVQATGFKATPAEILRRILREPRSTSGLFTYYQRLRIRKDANAAKVATARRLLTNVYRVLS